MTSSDALPIKNYSCHVRAGEKVALTAPNPVDRGKKGSRLRVLSEARGVPLALAVSGANTHDGLVLAGRWGRHAGAGLRGDLGSSTISAMLSTTATPAPKNALA